MIHYIADEKISAVIACMLSLQKKFRSAILTIAFNLIVKKVIKMLKDGEYFKFKNFEKQKIIIIITIHDLCGF